MLLPGLTHALVLRFLLQLRVAFLDQPIEAFALLKGLLKQGPIFQIQSI
jgi:hypothetical protein